ncbi:uncharacterized protein IWZ02DRAFT_292483 [Phyllosticta citriasiana]|uniref:Uncharacterized protein n=1 Tax=Phyllosticta citriasiana TaxID=595635 RepID=A0ABR1KPY9_9PEZI
MVGASARQEKSGGRKLVVQRVSRGRERPMSTTWPWTIRPALAVLWGVCWMFYPGDNGAVQTRVRASRIEPWLGWQGPTDGAYLQYGQQALGTMDSGRNSNDATSKTTNRRAGREATSMRHAPTPTPRKNKSRAITRLSTPKSRMLHKPSSRLRLRLRITLPVTHPAVTI